jgi:hypothetical protein
MIVMAQKREIFRDDITSWKEAFRQLCERGQEMNKLNPDIVVPADNLCDPEDCVLFQRADLMSLNKGTQHVFRDNRRQDSLQVRVYKDGLVDIENTQYQQPVYHIQLDRFDPSSDAVAAIGHFFVDVLGIQIPNTS